MGVYRVGARLVVIVILLVSLMSIGEPRPHEANAQTPGRASIVTMGAERNEFITDGRALVFTSVDRLLNPYITKNFLEVSVSGDNEWPYESYLLDFAAPRGDRLTEGVYNKAIAGERWEDGRRPGIWIESDDRDCPTDAHGRFEIKELVRARDYGVRRLWVVFQYQCGSAQPIFGEIRLNATIPNGLITPRVLRWPTVPQGGVRAVAPVAVTNVSEEPRAFGAASLSGSPLFDIRYDDCAGRTLAPAEQCRIWVHAGAETEGMHTAALSIHGTDEVYERVELHAAVRGTGGSAPTPAQHGAVVGGAPSRFTFESEPGDPIGDGESASYDGGESNVDVFAYGDHHGIVAGVQMHGLQPGSGGDSWGFYFVPTFGEVLAAGLTFPEPALLEYDEDESRYFEDPPTFDDPAAGLNIYRDHGEVCEIADGSYEIHALEIDPEYGYPYLAKFSASFDVLCEGATGRLRVRIDETR